MRKYYKSKYIINCVCRRSSVDGAIPNTFLHNKACVSLHTSMVDRKVNVNDWSKTYNVHTRDRTAYTAFIVCVTLFSLRIIVTTGPNLNHNLRLKTFEHEATAWKKEEKKRERVCGVARTIHRMCLYASGLVMTVYYFISFFAASHLVEHWFILLQFIPFRVWFYWSKFTNTFLSLSQSLLLSRSSRRPLSLALDVHSHVTAMKPNKACEGWLMLNGPIVDNILTPRWNYY